MNNISESHYGQDYASSSFITRVEIILQQTFVL